MNKFTEVSLAQKTSKHRNLIDAEFMYHAKVNRIDSSPFQHSKNVGANWRQHQSLTKKQLSQVYICTLQQLSLLAERISIFCTLKGFHISKAIE